MKVADEYIHVPCTRRLTSLDISNVYACVFRPAKSLMRTLWKHISLKLLVMFINLRKKKMFIAAHYFGGLRFVPSVTVFSQLNDWLILISCKIFLHLDFTMTSLNNRRQFKWQWFYDLIPFAKLVQKIFVGNHEPIVGICGKIFIIHLHNLQMLWIKNKFSECLARLHRHEAPHWNTFSRRFSPISQTRRTFGGSDPQIFYVPTKILLYSEKFVSNIL